MGTRFGAFRRRADHQPLREARASASPDLHLPPGVRRQILIEPATTFRSYVEYQSLYLDHATMRLIPNTEVRRGPLLEMQINSLGCKGPEIEPGRPVIAFFGDSATMGVESESWPFHVHVPGYAVLNAAIEGMSLVPMAERFEELAQQAPIACVVVCAGWHNLIFNESSDDFWHAQLSRFLGRDHLTAVWTIPTCLTDEVRQRGFSSLMRTEPEADINTDYFNFWMDMDPSSTVDALFDAIDRYNRFAVAFAEETGSILIDLHSFLLPSTYQEAPRDFFDVCHLRPRSYERVGRYVSDVLEQKLPNATAAATTITTQELEAREAEDLRKNIYRLW